MEEQFSRTALLLGDDAVEALGAKRVIVFGAGGVGSYVIEALARAGVGAITVVDNDKIAESNINRQLVALHSTVGREKAEVAAERVRDINPACNVTALCSFLLPENIDDFALKSYDYVVDAIDTVTAKIALAVVCGENGIPLLSSMGTGNKLDPSRFCITDLYKTTVCPLARVMRYELKKRGVKRLKVLFSTEEPRYSGKPPASVSFVPSVAGLMIAGEVIRDLTGIKLK